MNKFKITLTLILLVIAGKTSFTQLNVANTNSEKAAVQQAVEALFTAMYNNDSAALKRLFAPDARLLTIEDNNGVGAVSTFSVDDFAAAVSRPKTELWKEVAWSYTIEIDGQMASVWCPYSFFIETNGSKQFIHCGVNSVELFFSANGWLITQITDTRSTENCRTE